MLNDARRYGGVSTKSDHKLVIAKIAYSRVRLGYKKPVQRPKCFDCANLTSNKDTQYSYKQAIHDRLVDMPPVNNANEEMGNVFEVVTCEGGC